MFYILLNDTSIFADHENFDIDRAGSSTTRVLVLPQMMNMNILKTLYSGTTRVLIFQHSYSYVQYSSQPIFNTKNVLNIQGDVTIFSR